MKQEMHVLGIDIAKESREMLGAISPVVVG
jgi:hypothetical protein